MSFATSSDGQYHIEVAAQSDLVSNGSTSGCGGCDLFVADADDEMEEGEGGVHLLDDGVYKETVCGRQAPLNRQQTTLNYHPILHGRCHLVTHLKHLRTLTYPMC